MASNSLLLSVFIILSATLSVQSQWINARAVVYGTPSGNNTYGACYGGPRNGQIVGKFTASASAILFSNGTLNDCGACYQVRCVDSGRCKTSSPVTVTVTNRCTDGVNSTNPQCSYPKKQFSLSQPAFFSIVKNQFGAAAVEIQRVTCIRSGPLRVYVSGNPYYITFLFLNVPGSGTLSRVWVKSTGKWIEAKLRWGALWYVNDQPALKGASLSFLFQDKLTGKNYTVNNFLPANWKFETTYTAGQISPPPPKPVSSPPPPKPVSSPPPPKPVSSPPPPKPVSFPPPPKPVSPPINPVSPPTDPVSSPPKPVPSPPNPVSSPPTPVTSPPNPVSSPPPAPNPSVWIDSSASFTGNQRGSDNYGACYGNISQSSVLGNYIAAASSALFAQTSSNECGSCYEIKCMSKVYCAASSKTVTVTIGNRCVSSGSPNDRCGPNKTHFVLTRPAYGVLASFISGAIPIQYRRVLCPRAGKIQYYITGNRFWIVATILNVGGPGSLRGVSIKGTNTPWIPMTNTWGANWRVADKSELYNQALSFRLFSRLTNLTLTADNVAPRTWVFNRTYSGGQFSSLF